MKPPLTWLKMTPLNLLVILERRFQLAPAFLAPRLVAREHRFAERVLDALEIDFDLVADFQIGLTAGGCEFAQGHAAFRLQPDVDDGEVLFDADDGALDDRTFLQVSGPKGFIEHLGEVFTRGCLRCSGGHEVSC